MVWSVGRRLAMIVGKPVKPAIVGRLVDNLSSISLKGFDMAIGGGVSIRCRSLQNV